MGRGIKNTALFIIVILGLFVLNSCDNTLLDVVESKVAGATAITIDFNYTGAFEVSENFPVIFRFYPNPYSGDPETGETIRDIKLTKQGKVLVPESSLSPADSNKYFVVIFHDLNNDGVEKGIEDDALYVNNGDTNITYDISDEYIIEQVGDPFYLNLTDDVLMSIGEGYSISFADEQDYVDEWEPDNVYSSTNCDELTSGGSTTHWLGWEDTDYIKLSGLTNDQGYTVTIEEFESNNSTLDVSIMNYSGGTLTTISPNNISDTFPFSVNFTYNSGYGQIYLRVENPTSSDHGIGYYTATLAEN